MASFSWIQLVIGYLVCINIITLGLFWFDKWMARGRAWRVPEIILWLCAALGGSPGALLAMQWFRHKTKKLSFQLVFILILLTQVGVGVLVYTFYTR